MVVLGDSRTDCLPLDDVAVTSNCEWGGHSQEGDAENARESHESCKMHDACTKSISVAAAASAAVDARGRASLHGRGEGRVKLRVGFHSMNIRPVIAADRQRIHEILVAVNIFNEEEVRCAEELVELSIGEPEKGEYISYVAEDPAGAIHGYVCYGPTPLTDGVFDLYWIAIDPTRQGQGCGQILLRFVENEVRRMRGRMLLIETSSKESYASTMRFYERSGYDEISRIKDFYRIEDDKVVYCKRLVQ